MKQLAKTHSTHFHPYIFEKAKEAVLTIKTLKPMLTEAEVETLSLLLDNKAMAIIEKSVEEARAGLFEPLEQAINQP